MAQILQNKLGSKQWIKNVVPVITSFNSRKVYFLVTNDLPNAPTGSLVVPTMGFKTYMPLAESFTALLEDHLDRLEIGDYKIEDDEIQIFPYLSVPEAITRGVRIKASPLLISERTQPETGEFLWAYRIFMSMDENQDLNDNCQLVSRHWIIADGNGHVENVQGPGVVGLYPKMTPGAFFFYESCCPLSTVSGSMEGTFKMRRKDGFEFDAKVPKFEFKIPSVIRAKRKADAMSNQANNPNAAKKQKF
jgi:ApaG protein